VFKLAEIQERARLLRPGQRVVDLGAAPGGWTQYAAGIVGPAGRVVATDLLDMTPVPGALYIRGDFRDEEIVRQIRDALDDQPADVILSDLAPNLSGNRAVDQPRAMLLAELAVDLAAVVLRPGGDLVCKLFHGEGFDAFVRDIRQHFATVRVRKPAASRPESRETYLLARNYRV